jgi:hypothetical protein
MMQRWRIKWNEEKHDMSQQKYMTRYGGDLNQKQKLA